MRIFISYGRDHFAELALRLKKDLIDRGHEVWFDMDNLAVGRDFERDTEEGLNWVSAAEGDGRILLLMTPHSVRRPDGFCLNEVARAVSMGLFVAPVMVAWCVPPLSIYRIQWFDMQDCVPISHAVGKYEKKRDLLIEAIENRKFEFEGTQATLLASLKPIEFSAEIAQYVQRFYGRDWLLDRLEQWLRDPKSGRIFWIIGKPGSGKSAFSAYVCQSFREVAAVHLCRSGHDDKADPRRCVMSIAYQLSSQLPEYRDNLLNCLGDLGKTAATLFDNLLIQPLAMLTDPPKSPIIVVIDALDEATRNGRNELAEFIGQEMQRMPSWMRLIITSRPEAVVLQPLQSIFPHDIDSEQEETRHDIAKFLHEELSGGAAESTTTPEQIDALVEKCEGNFLYATLAIDEIQGDQTGSEDENTYPAGLGGRFSNWFSRQFPDIQEYQDKHRPLLELIIASRGPLPLDLARKILGWGPYEYAKNSHGRMGGLALEAVGALFPIRDGNIGVYHTAIAEWLIDPTNKAGQYFVDPHKGHERLADACLSECSAGQENVSPYCFEYLSSHLVELKRWEDVLDLISNNRLNWLQRWLEGGEVDNGIRCLEGVIDYLQSCADRNELVAELATQAGRLHVLRGNYDAAKQYYNQALHHASRWRGRRARVIAIHELGSLYLYANQLEKCKRSYRRALLLSMAGFTPFHGEIAANLIGLALLYQKEHRFNLSKRLCGWALVQARKGNDLVHTIAAHRHISIANKHTGDYADARIYLQVAKLLSEQTGLWLEITRLSNLKGWLEFDIATTRSESLEKASGAFQAALTEAQRAQDLYCSCESRLGLAWCALAIGNLDEADKWVDVTRKLLPRGSHADLHVALDVCSAARKHLCGDFEGAMNDYRQVAEYCSAHNHLSWKIRALVGLGAVQFHMGATDSANESWQDALATAQIFSDAKHRITLKSIALCREDSDASPR